ncbi:hypothetical protein ACFX19_028139 [Malus domestica]
MISSVVRSAALSMETLVTIAHLLKGIMVTEEKEVPPPPQQNCYCVPFFGVEGLQGHFLSGAMFLWLGPPEWYCEAVPEDQTTVISI